MKKYILAVSPFWAFLLFTAFSGGDIRIRTGDLKATVGSVVSVDGKVVGTAPCEFSLKTNVRHTIEVKQKDGETRTFSFIARDVPKSKVVEDIPDWFLNPDLLRSRYPEYATLAGGTAVSSTIEIAMSKAELDATTRLLQGKTSLFSGGKRSGEKEKLDSSSSQYYPKLTRGQMDSLAIATGGRTIVTTSAGTINRTTLQCEIQKVGTMFRVYILVGRKE